ncbi:millepora cytotoxin-1 [Patella vulgata]|uniref:millepora cytotoxin-1 n=1 Tax=Patella vulgata TaxID=6465 RepID=UPI00218065DE|nr:millepora cytotoxin-1 [Patella vulgata]
MEAVKILFVLSLILECCNCWVNKFDQPVSYECPLGQVLTKISSQHNNYYEDRQWDFQCAYSCALATSNSCKWTNKVNTYDHVMNFKCPSGGAITGIRSIHNNYYEDRVFDIKCCDVIKPPASCLWTKFENSYDGRLDYTIAANRYLNGIYSVHNNHYEDRRFKFNECDLPK